MIEATLSMLHLDDPDRPIERAKANGSWEILDSVEQLAGRMGCSERPVNRALEWLGAQGYLTKPIDVRNLLTTINDVLTTRAVAA
jgi:CheY-like chemotaxis protein